MTSGPDESRRLLSDRQTSFIGREGVIAAVRGAFGKSRLVTLTGFGGMGKSRLALAVAEEVHPSYRDGAWFVDLVPSNSDVLAETVLSAVDGHDHSVGSAHERLLAYLESRELLLILDNCEHVVDAAMALVSDILQRAPGVRVLATSRESLKGAGERVVPVPPLAVPPTDVATAVDTVTSFDAVRLLLDRAEAVNPGFGVTDENVEAIAELCRRLEGSPLALELAATRLRSMSVAQILTRIDTQLALFTRGDRAAPVRQQSLRALVDWSYDLCTEEERLMWRRASVFAGGFDLAAAEGVCTDAAVPTGDVVDLLDQLVSKSILVAQNDDSTIRFRFLETLRQYGFERLTTEKEADRILESHRDYYLRLADEILLSWCSDRQAGGISVLRTEQSNFERALEWSFGTAGQERSGIHLVNSLRFHWAVGGFLRQGRRWLDTALTSSPGSFPEEAGTALWVACWVALCQGDRESADGYLDHAQTLVDRRADRDLDIYVRLMRGTAALFRSDIETAIKLLDGANHDLLAKGDFACVLLGSMEHIIALAQNNDSEGARAVADRALDLSHRCGEQWGRCQALWALGFDRWLSGQLGEAEDLVRRALMMKPEFNRVGTALDLDLLSWIACSKGDDDRAVQLLGSAHALWSNLGSSVGAFGNHFGLHAEECRRTLQSRLPSERFDSLFAEAAQWDARQAVEFALRRTAEPSSAHPGIVAAMLTRREQQVAQMVADGMSNKEIAAGLVVSPRTVDGHLERIFTKLDFNSRSQLASWFTRVSTSENKG